jgi:phosphoglycerate dehydrogenase-like enzyme
MAEPFVLALMGPLQSPDLLDQLRGVGPAVEIVTMPYFESTELRTSKGLNGGRDPEGLPTPALSTEDRENLARAHGIVSMDMPAGLDELAPNLRWWQGIGAGFEHIDVGLLAEMGVIQTNASGIAAVPIAEFVLARLLQVWKQLRTLDERQQAREWEMLYGAQLEGRTLGVIGLGAIGREVAKRARAFGMTVLATRASAAPGDTDPDVDELHPAGALDEVLPRCDAVVLALPAHPDVEDLIDARRLALLPDAAILVNVARGMHVVEPALTEALKSGRLGAAVLDVTRQEPLPADDPLWDAPNLYLSPHSAVSLDRYEQTLVALVADNLRRIVAGEPLRNVVTPA